MAEYAYSRKIRWNYIVPAIASLLLVGGCWGGLITALFYPDTRLYLAFHKSGGWVLVFGALLSLFLAAGAVPSAWNRLYRFVVDNTSLKVLGPFGSRRYLWREITEIQIAKVPAAVGYRVIEQVVLRIFSERNVALITDEISNFNDLVAQINSIATRSKIPLFKTAGVRRWQKTPIDSLLIPL